MPLPICRGAGVLVSTTRWVDRIVAAMDAPISPARPAATPAPAKPFLDLAPGFGVAFAIAVVAWLLGAAAPTIGAPIFAIIIGVLIVNIVSGPTLSRRLKTKDVSGLALKTGIVLLGATLNLHDVERVGVGSLALLLSTLTAGIAFSLLVGRALGIDWRMRVLIGAGTTICGASAIAAVAPVVRAKTDEIAYSISVIFFFNMLAVFLFPAAGHLMGLTDQGFGAWAGTAVNDTSAVVAAGFAYSHAAGAYATVVKLTRTTFIVPMVLGLGLLMPFIDKDAGAPTTSLRVRLRRALPSFIGLFLVASLINTLGLIGPYAAPVQTVARFVMVVALAAVGLQGHWRAFAGAGPRPLLLGCGTWAVVALTSLLVQSWSGTL
jgi:uncharacterized integral membrane protein (TIGR00698 family)